MNSAERKRIEERIETATRRLRLCTGSADWRGAAAAAQEAADLEAELAAQSKGDAGQEPQRVTVRG